MCVLAIWLGIDPETTLHVGANRDEAYARPSDPPSKIEPGIFAGRDLESGGTWLGVARDELFVAVTNRRFPARTAESASRGVLTLEALRCSSIAAILDLVSNRVARNAYGGFNLVAIHGNAGTSLHFDGTLRRRHFGPGAHVITADYDLDDPRMPEKGVFDRFVAAHPGVPDDAALAALLSSHEGPRPICKHGEAFGTVSSAMISMGPGGTRFLFADGRPCITKHA